jgi:hypothetical protein
MRLVHFFALTISLFCSSLAVNLLAASPTDQLSAALDDMHFWLGDDDNGQRWKRFLKSEELAALAANPAVADSSRVQAILAIYEGDTAGLESKRFVAVRHALKNLAQDLGDPVPSPATNLPELLARIRGAKDEVRQITSEEVSAAKAELKKDLGSLAEFINRGPQANTDAWKKYLGWDSMMGELEKDNPDLAILDDALLALRGLGTDIDEGDDDKKRRVLAFGPWKDPSDEPDKTKGRHPVAVDRPEFTRVRDTLGRYRERVYFSNEQFAGAFEQAVERLATLVEAYDPDEPNTEAARDIGRILGFFERTGQIESVTDNVRKHVSHPNLFVTSSSNLISSAVNRVVDQTQGISDNILGTAISGTTRLTADLNAALVPNNKRATIDLELSGSAVSNNVGYNSGLTIYGTAYSRINASKRVYFESDSLVSDSATAHAPTSSNIHCITGRGPLARKIAWKRANASKCTAESIASGKAASRVAAGLDEQGAEQIAQANESMYEQFFAPLIRRHSSPERFDTRTTGDHLLVQLLQAAGGRRLSQIAAPSPPPDMEGQYDLTAWAHESVVRNFTESLIGGVMLTDKQIVDFHEQAGIEVPENLELGVEEDERWAITLLDSQPIDVRFQDGLVKVVVQIDSLHNGLGYPAVPKNRWVKIRVSADYEISLTNGGFQLVRPPGDVDVQFLNNDEVAQEGGNIVGLRPTFQNRFNDMLSEKLPRGEPTPLELEVGSKRIILETEEDSADSVGGWLSIGWKLKEVLTEEDPDDDNMAGLRDEAEPEANQTASNAHEPLG